MVWHLRITTIGVVDRVVEAAFEIEHASPQGSSNARSVDAQPTVGRSPRPNVEGQGLLVESEIAIQRHLIAAQPAVESGRELTIFAHGERDSRFIKKLRDQLEADITQSEQVLKPFELSFTDRIQGVVGKYVW